MKTETIHLKEIYPFLGDDGCDPTVDMYLPYNMTEMHRENRKRPCMIVCPGGGYAMCSQREAEPIAMHFLPDGFNVFVIYYSVAPHRFPTQMREVAATVELIYKNADNWNCDVSKLAIVGFSAGGHLAAARARGRHQHQRAGGLLRQRGAQQRRQGGRGDGCGHGGEPPWQGAPQGADPRISPLYHDCRRKGSAGVVCCK